jgi:hypothetical protein
MAGNGTFNEGSAEQSHPGFFIARASKTWFPMSFTIKRPGRSIPVAHR